MEREKINHLVVLPNGGMVRSDENPVLSPIREKSETGIEEMKTKTRTVMIIAKICETAMTATIIMEILDAK